MQLRFLHDIIITSLVWNNSHLEAEKALILRF